MKLKAVFLDKDGGIIPQIPGNAETSPVSLNDEVVEGLQLLQSNGYLLVLVSKQPGRTQVRFADGQTESNGSLNSACSKFGIYLDGFYYGADQGGLDRVQPRAPEPELLRKASEDMDIDLAASWMIGDIEDDVEVGTQAGCKSILIKNRNGFEAQTTTGIPQYEAEDLADAARFIVTGRQ